MKPPLVIDKSYANSNLRTLSRLANVYTLVMPTAFYYEVFDTTPEKRAKELKGFPSFRRIHIGTLLKRESETGKPVESVTCGEMIFNPEIASTSWQPSSEILWALEQHNTRNIVPHIDFFKNVKAERIVPGFSADELTGIWASDEQFVELCKKLREPLRIQRIADEIGWIHASKINPQWIYYRHFQTLVMQGLILLRRYPNPGDIFGEERTEHDVQDLEYLTLGLHANGLATAEVSDKLPKASMSWRFRILEPHGNLIVPRPNAKRCSS
jgi:hypothetical protein